VVDDFPVLHVGGVPYVRPPADWDLRVWGAVERPARWDLAEFTSLPITRVRCDIHCVTTWSKLDTVWEGVSLAWLLDEVRPLPECTHVVSHGENGYTANVPLEALRAPDVLLAHRFGGRPLEPVHGAPVRLMIPQLYFWKSTKWLRGLEFTVGDHPGFWEVRGYSDSADPWKEERYGF